MEEEVNQERGERLKAAGRDTGVKEEEQKRKEG